MDSFIKFLTALKSTPWWLSLAAAIVALLVFFVPSLTIIVAAPWLPAVLVIAIFFGLMFVFQMVDLAIKAISNHPRKTKRFHITPDEGMTKCYWTCTL